MPKNVLGIATDELVDAGIHFRKEILFAAGQRLGNGLEIGAAGGTKLKLSRIPLSTCRTIHIANLTPDSYEFQLILLRISDD
ncbi:MAG: hypothetical protein DMF62_16005 [Acidobacteria bacterium]|nr:MAG: hypothetical protein DMF62_16005 [Acidobacteriota bacterium]